ncbi:MAG: ribosomal protein S18-alanine N-acetyltransferase [Oscillospiraceae bacterium]|nr:ribosomal protein S18-alanine N-acetyltransferase [Oscillospiraceae bacterium]MBR6419360.1 ribosomal protein S18-alanine N-acetyltransferase [Oscillospiraceae bacterium]
MTQRADRSIELFSPDNIHSVAELAAACFSTPWSEAIYRRELENPQSVGFVCMAGGAAAGFIHCNFVLDELTLNTLCVAEQYRRQGIARALWAAVTDMMRGVCSVCYLEVRESNLPARTLYESLGFVQNGYRPRYYSQPDEAAVLMQCSI